MTTGYISKMGRKQQFTAHDILSIMKEFNEIGVVGSFVQQCYDYGNRGIVIKLSARNKESATRHKLLLLMESASRIHLIPAFTAIRPSPSGFCGKLRKHLKDRMVVKMEMVNNDRVIDFTFGSEEEGGFHLILELYASGNIILTDHEYKIMMLLHNHVYSEDVKVKMYQVYPKDQATVDPEKYLLTIDQLTVQLNDQLNEKRQKLRQMLLHTQLSVFGPVLIDHALAKYGIRKNQKFTVSDKLPDFEPVLDEIKRIQLVPGSKPMIILDQDGNYDSFVPTEYAHLTDKPTTVIGTFNETVASYFELVDAKIKQPKIKEVKSTTEKPLRKIDEQIKQLDESHHKTVSVIELMTERLPQIQSFIDSFSFTADGSNSRIDAIESMQEFPITVISQDHKKKTVTIDLEGHHITIDPSHSAHANLGLVHKNRKKLDYKKTRTEEAKLALTRLQAQKDKKKAGPKMDVSGFKPKKQYWFEKYNWFISSDGFLVIAGKTAQQNEEVVKKYMENHDIYVHSGVAGSGSCVIKTEKNQLPPKTLEQAGAFVICHTKAWKSGVPDRPWWVLPSQVSKTAQSGEYLTTGSFIIRGKKNFLPLPKMVLGLTFLFKNADLNQLCSKAKADLEYAVPMVAPYSAIEGARSKLIPGNIKAGKATKKIMVTFKKVSRPLEWEAIKRVSGDDISRVMVTGVKFFPAK